MKKYEYQTKMLSGHSTSIKQCDQVLNDMANEGWKLVEVATLSEQSKFFLFFEREIN